MYDTLFNDITIRTEVDKESEKSVVQDVGQQKAIPSVVKRGSPCPPGGLQKT